MSDFQQQYALWDEFLKIWPRERLVEMTLKEYSDAGSKESFTYWIESRLDEMGSIWGGSSFKFGVFSRKDLKDKQSGSKLSYSDTHGWYSSLGTTAQSAFEQVRDSVAHIAALAARGDLDGIESFEHLGEAYKWKIAFHYQNRQAPVIVDVFKREMLAAYVGGTSNQSMASLQKAALEKRPEDLGILEFGQPIWEEWAKKNLAIWKLSHGNPPNFTDAERQQYLDDQWAVMHRDTGKDQGKKFAEAPVGALFFLCHGNSPQRIGQFTSAAISCAKGEGWLQRSYRVLKTAQRTDRYTANSKNWSPQGNSTFWQVGEHDLPEFEATLLKPYFGTDLAELAALAGEPTETPNPGDGAEQPPLHTKVAGSKKSTTTCLNRIYYGPPGTGKTYTLIQLLKRDYEKPADSISADEWRTQVIAEKVAVLTWWEGLAAALHDLGGSAKVPALAEHPFIHAIAKAKGRNQGVKQTLWGTLQHHTVLESTTVNIKLRLGPAIFDKTTESVWHFSGEWQDACGDVIALVDQLKQGPQEVGAQAVQRHSFVTFHQSYGYEEFVEGLRPVLGGDVEASDVAYEIRPGVFKELCRRARQAPEQRFAMVIDEINRGNISKIFGELITLIEADKRDPLDGSPPPAEVLLAYSGEKFSVPANVDIIGTMNTADRSLALLDTALRRRFDFVPLMPDTRPYKDPDDPVSAPLSGLVVTTEVGVIDVRLLLHRINERIDAIYDRDHGIGHAYLTGLAAVEDGQARFEALAATFRHRILPLLEEYFFEDWQKIRLVLADNQKVDPTIQFVRESVDHEQDLSDLFGSAHGLDSYATKRRYSLQESAFSLPQAFIAIYQVSA